MTGSRELLPREQFSNSFLDAGHLRVWACLSLQIIAALSQRNTRRPELLSSITPSSWLLLAVRRDVTERPFLARDWVGRWAFDNRFVEDGRRAVRSVGVAEASSLCAKVASRRV